MWSAEYTGAGRTLKYNDVGYMARQNLHLLKASLGWRTLEPATLHAREERRVRGHADRNLVGPRPRPALRAERAARLRNFSSIFLAADFGPARFDDREVGNGTALQRARFLGGRFELATDPRSFLSRDARQPDAVHGRAAATRPPRRRSLVVHALRQLDIELLPQVTWSAGEYRYARQSVVRRLDRTTSAS